MNYQGIKISVGIDVHKKSWVIKPELPNGTQKAFSMSSPSSQALLKYMEKKYPGGSYEFVYEAGFSGFWLARQLNESGHKCIVINAADVPTTFKEKSRKTDKVDAKKLAICLKAGQLRAIHIPDKQLELDRGVINARNVVSKSLTRVKSQIRSRLNYLGYQTVNSRWSKAFLAELQPLRGTDMLIDELLIHYQFIRQRLLQARKRVKELSQTPRYKYRFEKLNQIKGVGLIVGMTYLTLIGNIDRFKNVDHYCSFLGFVPGTYNSGEKQRSRGMTKRCNQKLRAMLIQSSWVQVRSNPEMALKYEKLCQRMPGNRAIIRIAKTLIKRMRRTLNQGRMPSVG